MGLLEGKKMYHSQMRNDEKESKTEPEVPFPPFTGELHHIRRRDKKCSCAALARPESEKVLHGPS